MKLKDSNIHEFIKEAKVIFEEEWKIGFDEIEKQMQNHEMINRQFQTIYDQIKQKQKLIPKLNCDINAIDNVDNHIYELLANEITEGSDAM